MFSTRRLAFTLVELLVVIGIIAVLISVLLPALGSARRQAQAVKCLASLREIGNAFQMYSIDSKGYYPPSQLIVDDTSPPTRYNLYGTDFPADGYGAYWFNFLNKYVSKEKIGNEDTGGTTVNNVKTKSVFWGCPTFEAYGNDVTTSGTNRVQPGYGMNGQPTFDFNHPGSSLQPNPFGPPTVIPGKNTPYWEWTFNHYESSTLNFRWTPTRNKQIGFTKTKVWAKRAAERLLIADSRFWLASADYLADTKIPPQTVGNVNGDGGETSIDLWRHGKIGGTTTSGTKVKNLMTGKFAFNVLYADNHVATVTDPKEAYRAIRFN